ncbi:MAG: DUF397 domain-containing protein [Pseudonocardiaceae bacterium]
MTEMRWRKSSHSGTQSNCVELAHTPAAIRDSKNPAGPAGWLETCHAGSVAPGYPLTTRTTTGQARRLHRPMTTG